MNNNCEDKRNKISAKQAVWCFINYYIKLKNYEKMK